MALMSQSTLFDVRRVRPDDSIEDLTNLIHRAFDPLDRLGLSCAAATQSITDTERRVARGDCLLALRDHRVVGTLTMEASDGTSPCAWYRRADVASLHQFAVEPAQQGQGCGTLLLSRAETWACEHGCRELALETPERAAGLVRYYLARGFRVIQRWHKQGAAYTSIVLSKPVTGATLPAATWYSPHRRVVW
jgi:GNAT superfamily N-acetyltransferase